MRFLAAIERGDEDHPWGAVVLDLPGDFSAGDALAATAH